MGVDKFGRFFDNNNKIVQNSVTKSYINECMKKLREEREQQINSLMTYNNRLADVQQDLYKKTIDNIEERIKVIESKISLYNTIYTLDNNIEVIIKQIESKINKYSI